MAPLCSVLQDAYFNYDAETLPKRFLQQRRRWFNGILAGINGEVNPFSGIWWNASSKPLQLKMRNFIAMIQQYILVSQVRTTAIPSESSMLPPPPFSISPCQ